MSALVVYSPLEYSGVPGTSASADATAAIQKAIDQAAVAASDADTIGGLAVVSLCGLSWRATAPIQVKDNTVLMDCVIVNDAAKEGEAIIFMGDAKGAPQVRPGVERVRVVTSQRATV